MIRSYALTASTITNRVWAPLAVVLLELKIDTLFGGSEVAFMFTVAGLSSWLGWVLPLVVVEAWLIRDRTKRRVTARQALGWHLLGYLSVILSVHR